MEIAPIAGVRALPAFKPRPVDPELAALFDIEATAKPGEDTWTRRNRKAAGAEEDDDEFEEKEESAAGDPMMRAWSDPADRKISFFA